jgi:hypothetical protein
MVPQSKQKVVELALLLLLYGLCIALASALWAQPATLAICYVLVSILALSKWHAKADVVAYVVAAVLGPMGEAVVVHYGAWTYAKPSLLIPIWLPLLWGIAGFFLRRFTRTVTGIMQPDRE